MIIMTCDLIVFLHKRLNRTFIIFNEKDNADQKEIVEWQLSLRASGRLSIGYIAYIAAGRLAARTHYSIFFRSVCHMPTLHASINGLDPNRPGRFPALSVSGCLLRNV